MALADGIPLSCSVVERLDLNAAYARVANLNLTNNSLAKR